MENEETIEVNDDFFKEMEEWENNRHPFLKWVDSWFGGKLAGYRVSYALIRPHLVLSEAGRQIKWLFQRVTRQWDDRACWSVDWWLDEIMPQVLLQFIDVKFGTPLEFFDGMESDENYGYSDEQHDIATLLWNSEIWKMIAGFKASRELSDLEWNTPEERERLEEIYKIGMESFVKYYKNLWD